VSWFKDPAVVDKCLFAAKFTNVSWHTVVVIDIDIQNWWWGPWVDFSGTSICPSLLYRCEGDFFFYLFYY